MTVVREETLLTWPRVSVDGRDLDGVWAEQLTDVRVRAGLRAIGRATLTFADQGFALAEASTVTIGSKLSVTSVDLSATTLFVGTVTSVSSEMDNDGPRLVVVADDLAIELTRASGAETYHEMSLADVVTKLVTTPLRLGSKEGVPTTTTPFVLRNGSALALVDEIAQRYGLDWVVTQETFDLWIAATGGAPGATPVSLTLAIDLQTFAVRQVGDAPTDVTVRGWNPEQQTAVTGEASSPQSRSGQQPASGDKRNSYTGTRVSPASAQEAVLLARGIAARTGRMLARGRALFTPALRAGGTVTIDGAGPGNGTYYVREVTHVIDRSGARTLFVAGDRDPVTLADPWDQGWGPSSFRHAGLVVGVVDGLKDPAALGRVSVSLPTAAAQAKSAWARVVHMGAGAKRGQVFLPSVGDEVLVGFENDDVARPVVLGGLFSAKSVAPDQVLIQDGKVIGHLIRTETGHAVHLSEGSGPEESYIELLAAGGNQKVKLGKKGVDIVANGDVPLTVTVGRSSLTFDGKGAVTLKGSTITIEATDGIVLDSKQKIEAKGQLGVAIEGLEASIKGKASTKVEAGGILEIKGTMVKIN